MLDKLIGGVWSYVAMAVMAAVIIFGIYHAGYVAAERKSDIANVRAELATAKADLATSKQAAATAALQLAEMSKASTDNDLKIKDLTDAIAKRPTAAACVLGSDAGRLRNIR